MRERKYRSHPSLHSPLKTTMAVANGTDVKLDMEGVAMTTSSSSQDFRKRGMMITIKVGWTILPGRAPHPLTSVGPSRYRVAQSCDFVGAASVSGQFGGMDPRMVFALHFCWVWDSQEKVSSVA